LQIAVDDQGQDIAEYALMLTVILVLVVGTIWLGGSNANSAFSAPASAIQQIAKGNRRDPQTVADEKAGGCSPPAADRPRGEVSIRIESLQHHSHL
jgi:hypothetical protein